MTTDYWWAGEGVERQTTYMYIRVPTVNTCSSYNCPWPANGLAEVAIITYLHMGRVGACADDCG